MITALIVATLLSQQGICKPGVNCSVQSLTIPTAACTTQNQINLDGNTRTKGFCWNGSAMEIYGGGGATNGVRVNGSFGATSTITSAAANGSNGFSCSTNGCRLDLGTGSSDHLWSNGSSALAETLRINSSGTLDVWSTAYMHNAGTDNPLTVNDAQGLAVAGVATGSLAACNNTVPPSGTRGTIQYDTTTSTFKYCNGTTWTEFGDSSSPRIATWSAYQGQVALAAGTDFSYFRAHRPGIIVGLSSVVTAVGTGAGTITYRIMNTTSATELCEVVIGACTDAVGTLDDSGTCTGLFGAGDNLVMEIDAEGCTNIPLVNLTAEITE